MFWTVASLITALIWTLVVGNRAEETLWNATIDYREKWEMRQRARRTTRRSKTEEPAESLTASESFIIKYALPVIAALLSAAATLAPFLAIVVAVVSILFVIVLLYAELNAKTKQYATGICWLGTIAFVPIWCGFAYANPHLARGLLAGFIVAGLSILALWACGKARCYYATQKPRPRRREPESE